MPRHYDDPPEFREPYEAVPEIAAAFRDPNAGDRSALVDPPEFVPISAADAGAPSLDGDADRDRRVLSAWLARGWRLRLAGGAPTTTASGAPVIRPRRTRDRF